MGNKRHKVHMSHSLAVMQNKNISLEMNKKLFKRINL